MDERRTNLLKKLSLYEKNRAGVLKSPGTFLYTLIDAVRPISITLAAELEETAASGAVTSLDVEQAVVKINLLLAELAETKKQNTTRPTQSVANLPGVGPKTADELVRFGISTIEDVLLHFPFRYDLLTADGISEKRILSGVYEGGAPFYTRNRKKMFRAIFRASSGYFNGLWVNYAPKNLTKGEAYNLFGTVTAYDGIPAIFHPEFVTAEEMNRVRPVYNLPGKVSQKAFQKAVNVAVANFLNNYGESLPDKIREKYRFPDFDDAVKTVHFPETAANVQSLLTRTHPAYLRFIYEEFFYLQLGMLLKRKSYEAVQGIAFDVKREYLDEIKEIIPFRLTDAQRKVMVELLNDMKKPTQMNRLVQGDVGSGKTILSFIAGYIAVKNGYQVVILAPTEVLAEQHFHNLLQFLGSNGMTACALTGSVSKKEKETTKQLIENGDVDFIVGTHALIQENVAFKKLGLAIIDEQHRFGVAQRRTLIEKGYAPDIVLMTATPIPRTLALSLYGDLDVSSIDELPPGRVPIKTKWFMNNQTRRALEFVKAEIEKGRKAYFVYPLIDESDKLQVKAATQSHAEISAFFGADRVGLLHGKMKADEKKRLIDQFKNGSVQVLVSTTVIEVGVDVREATVMVIENAERFGLAQLHQLRGRVGRNDMQSYCLLVTSPELSENGQSRIDAMVKYTDGFKLAEIDLELRGAGDFFGTKQSGVPEFRFANVIRDFAVMQKARYDAEKILEEDATLSLPKNSRMAEILQSRWKDEFDFLNIG